MDKIRSSPDGVITRKELEQLFDELAKKLDVNKDKIEKIFSDMCNSGEILEAEQGKYRIYLY